MLKRILVACTLILLIAIGRTLFLVVPASGYFIDIENILIEKCEAIDVAAGPEDIAIDHLTGIAYIATTDRRDMSGRIRGGIYALDLKQVDAEPVNILGEIPTDFYAHGISLWRDDSQVRLMAINHSKSGEAVEIFDVIGGVTLRHVETISSDEMRSLNDLVAVGPREFYASNDTKFKHGVGQLLELYLGLPLGDVIYFDGNSARKVAGGFAYANGVNVSKDGLKLYVAEVIGRRINIFDRAIDTGELSNRQRFNLGSGADNIDIGRDGKIYIGAHPNLLAFSQHASNPKAVSPSQVIAFDPQTAATETVFMSANGELNGSATGAYWKGNLLVGGVYDPHIMKCRVE